MAHPNRFVPPSVMKMMAPRVAKAKNPSAEARPPGDGEEPDRKRAKSTDELDGSSAWADLILGPNEFKVILDMSGKTILGIDVDWADGKTLYIKSVQLGAVHQWNLAHAPDLEVKPGDRVMAVNGRSGDTAAMVRECRNSGRLELRVRSPRLIVRPKPIIPKEFQMDPQHPLRPPPVPVEKEQIISSDSLYGSLPTADPEKDKLAETEAKKRDIFSGPAAEDNPRLAIFLDIDGVLRKLEGCPTISFDGEVLPLTLSMRSRAFASEAVRALKFLVHRTGAGIVLSSEWRRDASLREEADSALRASGMRGLRDATAVLGAREDLVVGEQAAPDKEATALLRWAERRAREIGVWLQEHPKVKRWVALDDLDLRKADEVRLSDTPRMGPGLVLCDGELGLTMSNARAAAEILQS